MKQTTVVTTLLENERVKVVRMVSRPGDKGAMKERPDRVLYIIRGAKVKIHHLDGKSEDVVRETGAVIYLRANTNQIENIDTKDLDYISVHLK